MWETVARIIDGGWESIEVYVSVMQLSIDGPTGGVPNCRSTSGR